MADRTTTYNEEFDKILRSFHEAREMILLQSKETDKKFLLTDIRFQNTDKKFQDTDKKFQDTDKKFQDTDKKFQDTDKKFQDTDKKFQDYQKQMRKIETKFYSQWGRFVESLVEGSVLKLLQDKGIKVDRTSLREKSFFKGRQFEIDIIAKNGLEVVAVEVKTTLNPDDVKEFVEELKLFKGAFPEYADKKLYGAVAYIGKEGDADKFAESKGLFVIKSTNDSARITNKKSFKPKIW